MASVERPRRPASVIVLGVCQLVVGGVGLVYEGLALVGALGLLLSPAILKAATDADPTIGFRLQAPFYIQILIATSVMGLILSLVLIADGIGLLLVRRWAYNLGVLYGWLSIINQVVWLVFLFLIVMPVVTPAMDNMVVPPGTQQPQQYREGQKQRLLIEDGSDALGLLYPIFVLIMLAVTRKAFRRQKPVAAGAEDDGPDAAAESYAEPGEPDDHIGPARR